MFATKSLSYAFSLLSFGVHMSGAVAKKEETKTAEASKLTAVIKLVGDDEELKKEKKRSLKFICKTTEDLSGKLFLACKEEKAKEWSDKSQTIEDDVSLTKEDTEFEKDLDFVAGNIYRVVLEAEKAKHYGASYLYKNDKLEVVKADEKKEGWFAKYKWRVISIGITVAVILAVVIIYFVTASK